MAWNNLFAQGYTVLWKQLEQAQASGLPQTVQRVAGKIYDKAAREHRTGQLMKAWLVMAGAQAEITPDSLYTSIDNLERWVDSEPDTINQSVLHALLGRLYTLQRQRALYTNADATAIDSAEFPADMRQWTAAQFDAKIQLHINASLANPDLLSRASARDFVPLTKLGKDSEVFGHDLYHLLVDMAVGTLSRAADGESARIDRIYDDMQRFYERQTGRREAALQVALLRVARQSGVYADDEGGMQRATEARLAAYDALINSYADLPMVVDAYVGKARLLQGEHPSQALTLLNEALAAHPGSSSAATARNVRDEIQTPRLRMSVPLTLHPEDALAVQVNYANLSALRLRMVRTGLESVPDGYQSEADFKKLVALGTATVVDQRTLAPKPIARYEAADAPFMESQTTVNLSYSWSPGVYVLVAEPLDVAAGIQVSPSYQFVTVSRFFVMSQKLDNGECEFLTLDSKTGHPIGGVELTFYTPDNRGKSVHGRVLTNADGVARYALAGSFSCVARQGSDRSMRPYALYVYEPGQRTDWQAEQAKEHQHLTLLTDRTIYRPGQTVHVKGVSYTARGDEAAVSEQRPCTLVLTDANGSEVAKRQVVTNSFGSFSASFVLPTSSLNGMFCVSGVGEDGSVCFRVEEYKRPTFNIVFNPISTAYRVGDELTLRGTVSAYSGAPVQQLPLSYRVVERQPRFWRARGAERPLWADTVRIGQQGEFALPIKLQREGSVEVEVSVTNEAGETQTASTMFYVGPQAYVLDAGGIANVVRKDQPIHFTFTAQNSSNISIDTDVCYRLYRIDEPLPGQAEVYDAESEAQEEKIGAPMVQGVCRTGVEQVFDTWSSLPSAKYRLVLSVPSEDDLPQEQRAQSTVDFILFSSADKQLQSFVPLFVSSRSLTFDATNPAQFVVGTSLDEAYVLADISAGGRRVETRVLHLSNQLSTFTLPYRASYGTNVSINFYLVRNGQLYRDEVAVSLNAPQRQLQLRWSAFRDKLRPGQTEEWRLLVCHPDGTPASAEVLATLYDASLDRFVPGGGRVFEAIRHSFAPSAPWREGNVVRWGSSYARFKWTRRNEPASKTFDTFDLSGMPSAPFGGVLTLAENTIMEDGIMSVAKTEQTGVPVRNTLRRATAAGRMLAAKASATMDVTNEQSGGGNVNLRANFAETAFFYPHLQTNAQGEVIISFTMPQSLTRWNFRAYAHTPGMHTGLLQASVQASKDLMLQPNVPRYVREGDVVTLAAVVANQTATAMQGDVRLELFNPLTGRTLTTQTQPFSANANSVSNVSFTFTAESGLNLLGVRLMADGGQFSDGEQHLLPVLSNKQFVTETLPMSVRGGQTRQFSTQALFNHRDTLATGRRLTVQFTGNPAWMAVQALAQIERPASDNAISWATAFYANAMASAVAASIPNLQGVLAQWSSPHEGGQSLPGRLEQQAGLKEVLLSETPWLTDAQNETDRLQRLVTLFDANELAQRLQEAVRKLQALQRPDGGWGWFEGMESGVGTTTYVAGLLVRLQMQLAAGQPWSMTMPCAVQAEAMMQRAFAYLDREMVGEWKRQLSEQQKDGGRRPYLTSAAMQWLYLQALSHSPMPQGDVARARDYFLSLVPDNLGHGAIIDCAQSAIVLHAAGREAQAAAFIASLCEHLVQDDNFGAHFAFLDTPYSWRMMPIPQQVAAIEALQWVGGNDALAEEMKLWLLGQKQTQAWNSPLCTADAVYALLGRGTNLLTSTADVDIQIGAERLQTTPSSGQPAVAGLASVSHTYTDESTLDIPVITVSHAGGVGMAWGVAYAQCLVPMSEVRGTAGGTLSLDRQLYIERVGENGTKTLQRLVPGSVQAAVGDVVVSRLSLTLDRAMDYVQLTDRVAASLEPVATLSGHHRQGSAAFYLEVGDAACRLFFDHLGVGTHVLEVRYRVCRAGSYSLGASTAQSAYAPEFAAHSDGGVITTK